MFVNLLYVVVKYLIFLVIYRPRPSKCPVCPIISSSPNNQNPLPTSYNDFKDVKSVVWFDFMFL